MRKRRRTDGGEQMGENRWGRTDEGEQMRERGRRGRGGEQKRGKGRTDEGEGEAI